jgi:serine/threonine-protein kinase RsbW
MPIFAGTLDSLEPIRDYVSGAAARAGLESSATYKLCLAVDEIATNVVLHGYEEAGLTGDIDVESAIANGALVVSMRDTSARYAPDAHVVTEEDLAAPLEARDPGGLGLYLVKQSVDEFSYTHADGYNLHRFHVHLP